MNYITAGEAAHRLGVSDKTFRKLLKDGKVSFHRIGPKQYAIAENEVERLIRERSQLPQVGHPGADAGLLSRLETLEQRVVELEATIQELQRARTSETVPISTFAHKDTVPSPKPSEPREKASSGQPAPSGDIPPDCIHITAFAARYGVPENTVKRHVQVGFKQPDGSSDKLEASSRPRPGRPGQTTYFLTPEQQERAIDFWRRHNIKFVEQEG